MIVKKEAQKSKVIAKRMGDTVCDEIFNDFDANTRICGLTAGRFSLISLIHSLLKKVGSSEVVISTWSAGFYDINAIKELIDSKLITDFKIIIDRSFKTRQKNYSTLITDLFPNENIRTTDTHSKFVLIKNKDYNITIRSSMNLNENKRCENFELDNDIDIYNLFNDFVVDLFKKAPQGIISDRKIIDPIFDDLFSIEETKEQPKDIYDFDFSHIKFK